MKEFGSGIIIETMQLERKIPFSEWTELKKFIASYKENMLRPMFPIIFALLYPKVIIPGFGKGKSV